MDTLYIKCKKVKNVKKKETTQNLHIYICRFWVADTRKDCGLLRDRPVLSTGRTPNDEQNRNYPDYNRTVVMSLGGAQRQDGRTDWRTHRQF
jgi:hypothetical protein